MRSSYTKYCEKLKGVTKPAGQKDIKVFLKYIPPLYEAYKNYDATTIIKISALYVKAGHHLLPNIEDPDFKAAQSQILNGIEAINPEKQNTMELLNEYLIELHRIIESLFD